MLRVSEIFKSIQGEGFLQGNTTLFIRLSGCTRKCDFCDSKYHVKYKEYTVKDLLKEVKKIKCDSITITGGEPLLQLDQIREFEDKLRPRYLYHLAIETNGDLINADNITRLLLFDYICISPKDKKTAEKCFKLIRNSVKDYLNYDIKVVTDLDKVGVDMLKYATSVMPLTSYNKKKDQLIRQRVWNYCIEHNLHYSTREHIVVWGKKRGI